MLTAEEVCSVSALLCWTTWVSSCARRRRPASVAGVYASRAKTMSVPMVNARASTCSDDSAAAGPACTRTALKS